MIIEEWVQDNFMILWKQPEQYIVDTRKLQFLTKGLPSPNLRFAEFNFGRDGQDRSQKNPKRI